MPKPTVAFFGTGPVAAKSLALLAEWAEIETVITKPKPAHHRGSFPVLELAEQLDLPVLLVRDQTDLDPLFVNKSITSQLGILIDFGIIISQQVIDYFPRGIINSHFSVLPEWRGADPISFSILSGQKVSGVSIMLLVAALDEGPLLGYGEHPLDGSETTPELTERLIRLSDDLLRHEVPRYLSDKTKGFPQSITGRQTSYSRKLEKADGILDLSKSAPELEREVRAYLGWPGSRTTLAGKDIIVTAAHVSYEPVSDASSICLKTGKNYFCIDRLKPAGKQEMTARAFLAGYGSAL